MRREVIALVPMSFATDIMLCPSRYASCESISQHPRCAETVTAGRFAARNALASSLISPAAAARFAAFRHVQNACPTARAMLR